MSELEPDAGGPREGGKRPRPPRSRGRAPDGGEPAEGRLVALPGHGGLSRRLAFSAEQIGELMNRRQIAGGKLRAQLASTLRLSDIEIAALEQLLAHGSMTATQLGAQLGLSSGGVTGLAYRLERAGHVTREPHPSDRRSIVLSVTDDARRAICDQLEAFLDAHRELIRELTAEERQIVGTFLERALTIVQQHADALATQANVPRPGRRINNPLLWG